MAGPHFIVPTLPLGRVTTARLGSGNTSAAQRMSDVDAGKIVKLVGESQYDLAVAGDQIEGLVVSVEPATSGGWSVGGVIDDEKFFVLADGLQATPGTGVIAIGDYVVTGTVVAKGTAQASPYAKVTKATSQTPTPYAWRVVSRGAVGTGAVGTVLVIARV